MTDMEQKELEHIKTSIEKLIRGITNCLTGEAKKIDFLPLYYIHINLVKDILERALYLKQRACDISKESFTRLVHSYGTLNSNEQTKLLSSFPDKMFTCDTIRLIDSSCDYAIVAPELFQKYIDSLCEIVGQYEFVKGHALLKYLEKLEYWEVFDLEVGEYAFEGHAEIQLLDYLGIIRLSEEIVDGKRARKRKERYDEFINNSNNQREIQKETLSHFREIYNICCISLPFDSIKIIITSLFEALLKMQFSYNLTAGLKGKMKRDIAHIVDVSDKIMSEYVSVKYKTLPQTPTLYRLSRALNVSTEKLLSFRPKPSSEHVYSSQQVDEYIYDKYGLSKETLNHLQMIKGVSDEFRMPYICDGLNNFIQSCYWQKEVVPGDNEYIIIPDIDLKALRTLMELGRLASCYYLYEDIDDNADKYRVIKSDGEIEVIQYKGVTATISAKREVYEKGQYKVIESYVRDEYHFGSVIVKENIRHDGYELSDGHRKTYVGHESFNDYLRDGTMPKQYIRSGDREADIFSPMIRYMSATPTWKYTIEQRDLDFMWDTYKEYDETAVSDFLEEVSTNYGYTRYESDNIQMVEIIQALNAWRKEQISLE